MLKLGTFCPPPRLSTHGVVDFSAPVLRPRRFVVAQVGWLVLATADSFQGRVGGTRRYQPSSYALGALLPECQIVFFGPAALIAIAFDAGLGEAARNEVFAAVH